MNNYEKFFICGHNKNLENIQVTEKTIIYKNIRIINDKIQDIENGDCVNYIIQADYNNKTVTIKSDYLKENLIDLIIEKAMYLDNKKIDIINDLSRNNENNLNVCFDLKDDINKIISLDKMRKETWIFDNVLSSTYQMTRIINDLGLNMSTVKKLNKFSTEILIRNKETVKEASKVILFTDVIDYENILKNLIDRTLISVREKSIESGKYKVIMNGNIVQTIIKKIPELINIENIKNNTSFLSNKMNKKVFSDKLTITENPLDENMPGYCIFDDEGVATSNKILIKNGKIISYLCDKKSAYKYSTEPSGNSYGELSVRNMIIPPGDKSYSDLIKLMNNGIIIYDRVTSVFEKEITSGNISFQAYGLLVENGKIVSGLKTFIVSTTYNDLFKNIIEIGNDLVFDNIVGASPSIIFDNVNITI